MKRLFVVKNGRGNVVDNPATGDKYFNNKMEAKKLRDKLTELPPYTIGRGPDHMGKHGSYGPAPMRRQPKRRYV